jgi:hypothetical protein
MAKMAKMVKNDQKWSKMTKNGVFGQNPKVLIPYQYFSKSQKTTFFDPFLTLFGVKFRGGPPPKKGVYTPISIKYARF